MATKYNRIYRPLSAIILLCLLSANVFSKQLIDKIAIIVNDSIIVESEINKQLLEFKNRAKATKKKIPDDKTLYKLITDQLILRAIKLQLAKEQGIKATIENVDNTLNLLAKQNNISRQQLIEIIKEQQGDYLQFRKKIADDYVISQLQQNTIQARIQINEQDLKEEIKLIEKERNKDSQYHLIHYLISASLNKQQLLNTAKTVKAKLIAGESIKTIKAQLSQQVTVHEKDLGLRKASALPEIFINAITGLNKNQYTQPIVTPNAIHILKVINIIGPEKIIKPEMKARHILLKVNKLRDNQETLKQITKIRQRIRQGEDFATLAKEYSEDPGSAVSGGDLGWFAAGTMVQAFQNKLNQLNINEVSEPFKSQFGWHIVQLQGKRDTDKTDEKIKEIAQQVLISKKVTTDTKRWEDRIRQEAYVEFLND